MKVFKYLLFALAVFTLGACSSTEDSSPCPGFDYSGKTTLPVTGAFEVEEGQKPVVWPAKSIIGLYAFRSGQDHTEASIYAKKANIKYTTLQEVEVAKFGSAVESQAIQLKTGSLDIRAYYPYKNNIEGLIYPIDLKTDKSVYYAENVNGIQPKERIDLVFHQLLSKLVVKVKAGENVSSLTKMQSSALKDALIKGNFNLATGVVNVDDAVTGDIPTTAVLGEKESSVSAPLLPGQPLNKTSIVFTVDNKNYTWSITEDVLVESGKVYTYTLIINADGSWTVVPQGEITDWNEGNTDGDISVITPDGDGSTLNPDGDIEDWEDGEGDTSVITPDEGEEVPVGTEVVVMNETWGVNGTERWDLKNEMFNTYTDFDTKNVTFSNEGTRLSARALNTVRDDKNKFDKHIWFPRFDDNLDGKKPSTPTLAIRNINTANLKDITITYSILGDMRTTMKEYINTTFVKVYADGQKLQVPSVDLFSTEYSNKYYTITLKVDKPFSELIFKTDMSNYTGIRLDNVIIKGVKAK